MKFSVLSKLFRVFVISSLFIFPVLIVILHVRAATTATTLNQAITAGTLAVNIVDGSGAVVSSPSITFSSATFSFAVQNSTGILGTATQKIRLDNPTATVAWSVSLAATGGDSAVWTNGGALTYPYNNATQNNGRLAVDPSVGTITPWGSCVNTNVSKGSADYFVVTTKQSITLMSATAGANTYCRWDLTGVGLTQTIPASQAVANYSIAMTITAL